MVLRLAMLILRRGLSLSLRYSLTDRLPRQVDLCSHHEPCGLVSTIDTPPLDHGCSPSLSILNPSTFNLIPLPSSTILLFSLAQPNSPQPITPHPHNADPSARASSQNSLLAATQTGGMSKRKSKSVSISATKLDRGCELDDHFGHLPSDGLGLSTLAFGPDIATSQEPSL